VVGAYAADDDVGAVPENAWTEDVEDGAGDRDHRHEAEDDPHRSEHATQAAQRVLEVLRPLARNAGRVPSAGSSGLGRREVELLDEPEEVPQSAAPAVIERAAGAVEFAGVSFRYELERPLIDDLDLVVDAGRTVASVGQTGAGKTTLLNLLMRFYEIAGGRITVDAVDIRVLTRGDLRRQFGIALLDWLLLNGTIR